MPKGREFWLEASNDDGSLRYIQRFDDEGAAVQQMRRLQELADRPSAGKRSEAPRSTPTETKDE